MLLYLKLIRPVNLIILALTQYLVMLFLIRPIMLLNGCDVMMSRFDFAMLVVSHVLLAAAGYAINDYFDMRSDTINKPDKNVLLLGIPRKHAQTLNYILNTVACLLGFYCAYKVGFIQLGFLPVVVALALYYYALKYKRQFLTGNLVVSLLIAYSVLVVWLFHFFAIKAHPEVFARMINSFGIITYLVLGFAIFAFLITLIREIIKDMEDMEGDREDGCDTLAIRLGITKTKKVLVGLIILTMLLLALAQFILYTHYFTAVLYLLIVQGMMVFLWIKTMKSNEKNDFHFLSVFTKIIMITGLLATQLLYISF